MTRLLVLGLLEEGPMSGYDIQQKLRRADAERWGGVLTGSIYHALNKLEQERHISLAGVERTGHRQKAVYQITAQGRDYLCTLLAECLRTPVHLYPTALYSALSLVDKIPQEMARKALEEQRERLEAEYQGLEAGERSNEGRTVPALSRLVINSMFALLRQQQELVERVLEELGQ